MHDSKPHELQALTAEPRPTGLHILPAIIRSQVCALSRAIPCLLLPPGPSILCAYFGALQRAKNWGLISWGAVAHSMACEQDSLESGVGIFGMICFWILGIPTNTAKGRQTGYDRRACINKGSPSPLRKERIQSHCAFH